MAAGGEPSPGGSPALTPQANRGDQASADAKVQMAMRLLEEAMMAYGDRKSAKYRQTLTALSALVKGHGRDEDRAQAIMPAELKSALLSNAPAPGAAPPPPGGPGAGAGALPAGGPPGAPG
jgi:hypothetical protein